MTTARKPAALALLGALLLSTACGGSAPAPTAVGGGGTPSPAVAATSPALGETAQPTAHATETAAPLPTEAATAPAVPAGGTETAPLDATIVPGEGTAGPATTQEPEATTEATPVAEEPAAGGAAYTGRVVGADGKPVPGAMVYAGDAMRRADARGAFELSAPGGSKRLTVMAPGFVKREVTLQGADAGTVRLEPFVAKGVYVSGVGDDAVRSRFYKLLDDTELNAIVINVKNDDGKVWTSKVPLARQTEASYTDFDLPAFVREAHARGIYVIGRFTTFRDPNLAEARKDLAVSSTQGGVWQDNQGHKWVDPFDKRVWDYFGDLGEEIAASGIDEIQFDYVRFPVDGDLDSIEYLKPSTRTNRPETITAFLRYMHDRLRRHRVFISADTYGLTVVSEKEQGTGQILKNLAPYLDYYSPMIYPDHYAPGSFGFAVPSAHPYEVIEGSVEQARQKLRGTGVLVRPYLSAFRDTQYDQPFGLPQFLAQKRAAEAAGSWGWIYWNAGLTYPDELFRPE